MNLSFNRARYLNVESGRFLQVDKYNGNTNNPNSLHKYLYGYNDPVNNIDPTGFFSLKELFVVGGIIVVLAVLFGISLYHTNRPEKETSNISVFIWNYRGSGQIGHASMRLSNGTYISWWPQYGGSLGCQPAIQDNTYEHD